MRKKAFSPSLKVTWVKPEAKKATINGMTNFVPKSFLRKVSKIQKPTQRIKQITPNAPEVAKISKVSLWAWPPK
jgi:hypothetical protein